MACRSTAGRADSRPPQTQLLSVAYSRLRSRTAPRGQKPPAVAVSFGENHTSNRMARCSPQSKGENVQRLQFRCCSSRSDNRRIEDRGRRRCWKARASIHRHPNPHVSRDRSSARGNGNGQEAGQRQTVMGSLVLAMSRRSRTSALAGISSHRLANFSREIRDISPQRVKAVTSVLGDNRGLKKFPDLRHVTQQSFLDHTLSNRGIGLIKLVVGDYSNRWKLCPCGGHLRCGRLLRCQARFN